MHTGKTRKSERWLQEGSTSPSKLLERPWGLGPAETHSHMLVHARGNWRLKDPRASYSTDRVSKAIHSVCLYTCCCAQETQSTSDWSGTGAGVPMCQQLWRPGSQMLATGQTECLKSSTGRIYIMYMCSYIYQFCTSRLSPSPAKGTRWGCWCCLHSCCLFCMCWSVWPDMCMCMYIHVGMHVQPCCCPDLGRWSCNSLFSIIFPLTCMQRQLQRARCALRSQPGHSACRRSSAPDSRQVPTGDTEAVPHIWLSLSHGVFAHKQ